MPDDRRPPAPSSGRPAARGPVVPTGRPFPLHAGQLEVSAAERITPRTVRLTLTADAVVAFPDEEPGEVVTLLWPAEGADEVVLPSGGWRFAPGTPPQHARNYTIRTIDRTRGELTIDFALHGEPGRATDWGASARRGSRVAFAGPRVHYVTDPRADWTLLCADETGLPALAATLERLPAGHPTLAFVEVRDAAEELAIESRADVALTWLHRGPDAPPGGPALERAVRSAALPGGRPSVWAGAEAGSVRAVRELVRDELGLPLERLQARGYWKHRGTLATVDDDILPASR